MSSSVGLCRNVSRHSVTAHVVSRSPTLVYGLKSTERDGPELLFRILESTTIFRNLYFTFPIVQSPEICLCFRRCLLRWMEFAICALWVRSFLSGPGTGGRIRYYPTDREPNSETVRIPRSPRIKRYRAFWSSSRWRLFCPSPWFPRRGSSASPPRRFGGSLLRHSVEARRRLLLGDSEARCSAIA